MINSWRLVARGRLTKEIEKETNENCRLLRDEERA